LLLSHNQGYQVSVSENPHKKTILGSHKNYKKGNKPNNRHQQEPGIQENPAVLESFLKSLSARDGHLYQHPLSLQTT
jgi:hypothetical protein